eukprot:scaffold108863_cov23-Tisochrysis_lutea.AAC.3
MPTDSARVLSLRTVDDDATPQPSRYSSAYDGTQVRLLRHRSSHARVALLEPMWSLPSFLFAPVLLFIRW